MAKSKYSQEEVTESLMQVFRQVGYEGASLEELAKAAGLRKSSLYHRYPGGKKEMAEEVLKYANNWIRENVTSVLQAEGDPDKRLKKALEAIDELYKGGRRACIIRALSMDTGLDLFSKLISEAFEDLLSGFTKLLSDMGYSKRESVRHTENIIIMIQGALIVGRGTRDDKLFKRVLNEIKEFLTNR